MTLVDQRYRMFQGGPLTPRIIAQRDRPGRDWSNMFGLRPRAGGQDPFGPPMFLLNFTDAGSGAANTTPQYAVNATATFARANATATTVLSTGYISSAIGANTLRSYYDPQTRAYCGAVFEPSRQNLALYSEVFDNAGSGGAWANTDSTAADGQTSPRNDATADLITEGVAGTAQVTQAATITANAYVSYSTFLKRGNNDYIRLIVYETANAANFIKCWINTNTGAAGSVANGGTGANAAIVVKPYPAVAGWYRVTLTGQVNNSATAVTFGTCSASADNSDTRTNSATYAVWGAMLEDSATYSSTYIATTSSAATRSGDNLSYDPSNFNALAGSCVAEVYPLTNAANVASGRLVWAAGTTSGGLTYNASGVVAATDNANTVTSGAALSRETRYMAGATWGSGLNVQRSGAAVGSGSFDGDIATVLTNLYLGCGGASGQPVVCIKTAAVWGNQLSLDALQRMVGSS